MNVLTLQYQAKQTVQRFSLWLTCARLFSLTHLSNGIFTLTQDDRISDIMV